MSREIKFRAWQKHHKKMIEVGAIQFPDPAVPDRPSFVVKRDSLETWTLDEVELMQFAGVKDRNGKDIYEGDILGLDDPTDQSRAFVVFHNGAFRQQLVRLPIFGDDWDWLVIGNIYENPGLVAKEES